MGRKQKLRREKKAKEKNDQKLASTTSASATRTGQGTATESTTTDCYDINVFLDYDQKLAASDTNLFLINDQSPTTTFNFSSKPKPELVAASLPRGRLTTGSCFENSTPSPSMFESAFTGLKLSSSATDVRSTPNPIGPSSSTTTSTTTSDTGTGTGTGISTGIESTTTAYHDNNIFVELAGVKFTDLEFPKSDAYVRKSLSEVMRLGMNNVYSIFSHAAIQHGCVHSMYAIGAVCSNLGAHPNFVLPWILEGSLRGSLRCIVFLLNHIYHKAEPHHPLVLLKYWMKIVAKHDDSLADTFKKSQLKDLSDTINRVCAICKKRDTDTLTLTQCIGCSAYCYCGKICQVRHWEDSHKGECKQLRIMNKYHKPHATEIRDASIRGVIDIPVLEKLRSKLGLTRPQKDYKEMIAYNTHEGKQMRRFEYVIGRDDGTVWIGSYPERMGVFSRGFG